MAIAHYLGALGLARIEPDAGPLAVISYPKCGRTWLKVMLGKALCSYYQLPDHLALKCYDRRRLPLRVRARFPSIRFSHAGTGSGCFTPLDKLSPAPHTYSEQVALIVREPKDVLVSFYHHLLHRTRFKDELAASEGAGAEEDSRNWTRAQFNEWASLETDEQGVASLSSYLRSPRFGAARLLTFYRLWSDANDQQRPHIIRYEDMHAEPLTALASLLEFLGLGNIPDRQLRGAIDFASFDHMREMEKTNALDSSALKVVDPANEAGFKTREGRTGGFAAHMTPEDIAFVDDLTRSFGCPFYSPNPTATHTT